jgi:hypothetical protein
VKITNSIGLLSCRDMQTEMCSVLLHAEARVECIAKLYWEASQNAGNGAINATHDGTEGPSGQKPKVKTDGRYRTGQN